MNKVEKIAIILAIIFSVVSVVISITKTKSQNVGNIFTESHAYSTGTRYSSIQLTNSLATLLVSRATSSRSFCEVCQSSTSTEMIYLFKQGTSTGVAVNLGYPLHPTSTPNGNVCAVYGASDPWIGQVWGISPATTTAKVMCAQE